MDLERIKQNYQQMPDFKIIELANNESHQLSPEALKILIEEIRVRNLPQQLVETIAVKTKALSEEEFNEYSELIRNLPDPVTGLTSKKLNATVVSQTMSFIVISRRTSNYFIGNEDSIRSKLDDATKMTAAFGWWGGGIFSSFKAIRQNNEMTKLDYSKPTEIFRSFIIQNLGYIETHKKDKQKLMELIKNTNG